MCCDLLLCETSNGKAYQSTCDGSYVIMYQNVVLQLNESSVLNLIENTRECLLESSKDQLDENDRHFVFNTTAKNVLLSFSSHELKELNYLLESAILETMEHVPTKII